MAMTDDATRSRFWKKVDRGGNEHDCWIWTGGVNGRGYGQFTFNGKHTGAHRVAYIMAHDQIPSNLCVCHRCDNPRCVNPTHLFLGSHLDNARDRDAKGRHQHGNRHFMRLHPEKRPVGEKSPTAKLTWPMVREIRKRHREGAKAFRLAKEYKLSWAAMWALLHYKTWREDALAPAV